MNRRLPRPPARSKGSKPWPCTDPKPADWPRPPNRGSAGSKKEPLQWKAWEIGDILRHAEGLSTAVAAYFRAIDGEGDPKAIRQAVETMRAAHRNYEQAKGEAS